MKIYHNPRCGTSRKTLSMITDAGIKPEIVLYMKNSLTEEELTDLLKKLSMSAEDLVRTSEAIYTERFSAQPLNETEWIKAMIKYPKLMERPIVVKGDKAILGRPPQAVASFLK